MGRRSLTGVMRRWVAVQAGMAVVLIQTPPFRRSGRLRLIVG